MKKDFKTFLRKMWNSWYTNTFFTSFKWPCWKIFFSFKVSKKDFWVKFSKILKDFFFSHVFFVFLFCLWAKRKPLNKSMLKFSYISFQIDKKEKENYLKLMWFRNFFYELTIHCHGKLKLWLWLWLSNEFTKLMDMNWKKSH